MCLMVNATHGFTCTLHFFDTLSHRATICNKLHVKFQNFLQSVHQWNDLVYIIMLSLNWVEFGSSLHLVSIFCSCIKGLSQLIWRRPGSRFRARPGRQHSPDTGACCMRSRWFSGKRVSVHCTMGMLLTENISYTSNWQCFVQHWCVW